MSKKIIICFDGTRNDPADAAQEIEEHGGIEDDGISNILKLYFLLGGKIENLNDTGVDPDYPLLSSAFTNQIVFYFQGVGTYGGPIRKLLNAALSPRLLDVRAIMRNGYDAIRHVYEPGDEIFLFGFSRGAAIARRFASKLKEDVETVTDDTPVRFLGAFDTVASIGPPNLNPNDYPHTRVLFENANRISPNIREALHLVALDERRIAFQPTLMAAEDRVSEVWFPGVHSDIGGGYYFDGLSDITLDYMMRELRRRQLGLEFRTDKVVAAEEFKDDKFGFDVEDIRIRPSHLSKLHWHSRLFDATLDNRDVRVCHSGNNSALTREPLLHHSAADLMAADPTYSPAAYVKGDKLAKITHHIVNPDGTIGDAIQMTPKRYRTPLFRSNISIEPGKSAKIDVHATQRFCPAYLNVKEGEKYRFTVDPNSFWYDASIKCDAKGWKTKEKLGLIQRVAVDFFEESRRHPDADWFEILGSTARDDITVFRPLLFRNVDFTVPRDGEFFFFPNDLSSKYDNNRGAITITVRRTA